LCADRFGGATTAVTGYTKSSSRGVANSIVNSYEHQDGGGVEEGVRVGRRCKCAGRWSQ
jgi:hypothetical protein